MLDFLIFSTDIDPSKIENGRWSALHHAAAAITSEDLFIKLLDPSLNIDVRSMTKNSEEYTPLHIAIKRNNSAAVLCLMERGADCLAKTKRGDTGWELIFKSKNESLIQEIFKYVQSDADQLMMFLYFADLAKYKVSDDMISKAIGTYKNENPREWVGCYVPYTMAHRIFSNCKDMINSGSPEKKQLGLNILANINNYESLDQSHQETQRTCLSTLFRKIATNDPNKQFLREEHHRGTEKTAIYDAAHFYDSLSKRGSIKVPQQKSKQVVANRPGVNSPLRDLSVFKPDSSSSSYSASLLPSNKSKREK